MKMNNMDAHFAKRSHQYRRAFTLVELLVVIAIIAIIAGFTLVGLKTIKARQYKNTASAELERLETALENYKAKYGVYPPDNKNNPLLPQLYYELSGTTRNGNNFTTLDGSSSIASGDVSTAYGVGGFVNCSQGSVEDGTVAKNFLSGFNTKEISYNFTNNSVQTAVLVTSVGGPDSTYQPLNASGLNPFRYVYPGVNNPGSYDLWVQLVINGQTNLVCNWSREVQINSPLP
jgi:prepilin-type N-terminal cleavage/methylation domain-containing protein